MTDTRWYYMKFFLFRENNRKSYIKRFNDFRSQIIERLPFNNKSLHLSYQFDHNTMFNTIVDAFPGNCQSCLYNYTATYLLV